MPKCEADEEALAHLVLAFGHSLESLLLVVNFFVLCHISFIGKVVKVARIGL